MPLTVAPTQSLRLSICITTFNRAAFIGATLESILLQTTDGCEVIILDASSNDNTETVIAEYTKRFDRLRYIRQDANNGIDRDYNRTVELAKGEYCWLMSDDDLLTPSAVATVLAMLHPRVSLIIVNAECRNLDMSKVLQDRWLNFESDRVYKPEEIDSLFVDVGGALNCYHFVIRREIWLARNKDRYYGSLLVYMWVIFQERLPGDCVVIARPLVSYRRGNSHTFSARIAELAWVKWPSVAMSLAVSESARRQVPSTEPWRNLQWLLLLRGLDLYSWTEYRLWIRPRQLPIHQTLSLVLVAMIPSVLINVLLVLYFSLSRRPYQGRRPSMYLQLLKESPAYILKWRHSERRRCINSDRAQTT